MKEEKDRIKGYLAQAYICAREGFDKKLDAEDALHLVITFLDRFIEANDEYTNIEAYYYTRGIPEGFCPNSFNPKLFTNEGRKQKRNLNDGSGT